MEHLPPWLRNVSLPARPVSRADAPAPAPKPSTNDAEMPTWLRELQQEVADDGASSPSAAPSSDWLTDLTPAATDPAPTPPASAKAASWLDSLGDDQPPPAPPQAPAASADDRQTSTTSRIRMPVGATDWLRSMGHDPDARSEPLSEPINTPEESNGVPDWLRELSEDDVARAIEAETSESQPRFDPQAPGWLTEDPPSPDASTVSANWMGKGAPSDETSDQAPDWLQAAVEADIGGVEREHRAPAPPSDLAGSAEVPAWLRDLGNDEEPVAEAPPTDEEPAWLRDAASKTPTDHLSSRPADAADDVPAWLRDAAPEPPVRAHADALPTPPRPTDDVPAWLRDAAPEPPARAQADAQPTPPRPADDVPAWLRDVATPPGDNNDAVPSWLQEAETPLATAGNDVPAWLHDDSATPAAPESAPASGDDEMPSWLRESAAPPADVGETPPQRQATPASPPPDAEAVPSWLDEEGSTPDPAWLRDAPPEPAEPSAEMLAWAQEDTAPPPSASQPDAKDLPPWLLTGEPPDAEARPGATTDPGLPSWLRGIADEPPAAPRPDVAAPPPPRRPIPAAEQNESNSFLSGAELPSWLRVPEPERPVDSGEGQALDWLRQLGASDQQEDEAQIAAIADVAVPQRPQYTRTAEQMAAVALLQQINRTPYPEPAIPVAASPLTRWQRIGLDRVLYLLLALALLVALIAPVLTTPFQTATPTSPESTELGALLDSFTSDSVALVAYEWGAQRSSELRPLEEAVTKRLLANKTKLILVSTDMQGTLLSFDLVGPLRTAGYNNENGVNFGGRDYVLLGYKPGGELALRSLTQDLRAELKSDFDGQDASQSLVANRPDGTPRFTGMSDLSMILVMADQPQDVQAWMEQVHPMARNVPIVFLLPQEAQPLVQPYLRLPNVYHLAGQQGALALAAGDATGDPTAVARSTGQLWFAVVVFLLLLVGGAVSSAISHRRTTRGGAA